MNRPIWSLEEVVTASAGALDLANSPATKTGGPEGVPQPAQAGGGAGGGGPIRAAGASVTGVSIDTRTLAPGDLFVALTDARDGHAFVTDAFARGAAAALVRSDYARKPGDGALIRVDDPLGALGRIGVAARARLSPSARVIAVTGSAGKTGTKEMLRACLKVCASAPERVHAPEKSYNNHWGVPLTLARMPADTEFAVFEIGMNHAGEIRPLAKMVRPHIAIVTNVLPVHVGNFADGEIGVAKAKAEIFEGLEAGGTAIILRDSPHYLLLRAAASGASVRTFGTSPDSDFRRANVSGVQAGGRQYVQVETGRPDGKFGYDLGMLGLHLAMNSLAVVAALDVIGCDVARVSRALAGVASAQGRGARVSLAAEGREILLLDESYNANPASMAAALENLSNVDPAGRRIAVIGDMLELAPTDSPHIAIGYHEDLLPGLARIDLVLCCGPNMRHLYDALPPDKRAAWAPTSIDLVAHVLATLRPGDAVMVKGSLGSRMAPIVEAIKKRFAPPGAGG